MIIRSSIFSLRDRGSSSGCLACFLVILSLAVIDKCVAGELLAGIAKVEATPELGVSLNGPISKPGPARGVHDPLHVRALVLSNSGVKLALVVCDNCMIGPDVVQSAKEMASLPSGLAQDHILIAATHTHAAPRAVHISRTNIDDKYHKKLAKQIAEAIIDAAASLEPVKVGFATFERSDLLSCRRKKCEPGSVGPSPFGDASETVKSVAGSSRAVIGPAGPVDPEFSVIEFRRLNNSKLCVIGNFGVHYCGGYAGGKISADYFGFFCSAVEKTQQSEPLLGMMFNGTSGDVGSFTRTQKKYLPFEAMQVYGRELASQALAAVDKGRFEPGLELQVIESRIQIGVRKPSKRRLAWAKDMLASEGEKLPHRWTKIYAQEALYLSSYPEHVELVLQAIRIGDIAITANPCETFASTGLQVKQASPFEKTINFELANGYGGYLPPREQHMLGGYETWPARSSFLDVDAEEQIRLELLRLLGELER